MLWLCFGSLQVCCLPPASSEVLRHYRLFLLRRQCWVWTKSAAVEAVCTCITGANGSRCAAGTNSDTLYEFWVHSQVSIHLIRVWHICPFLTFSRKEFGLWERVKAAAVSLSLPKINTLLCFHLLCTLNLLDIYLYIVWFSHLSSLSHLGIYESAGGSWPISAVNPLTPRLHEWGEGAKERGAPEKMLCAGLEGAEASACQRLWF